MSDPTGDKTGHSIVDSLDDDDVDALLDRLAERADERDLQLPGGGASRRGVLAALLGAGGIGAAASQAVGESESYGSSTGVAGTDSEPLSEANVQDLHAEELEVVSQASLPAESPSDVSANRSFGTTFTNSAGTWKWVTVVVEPSADNVTVNLALNVDSVSVGRAKDIRDTGQEVTVQGIVPDGSDYECAAFGDTGSYSIDTWAEYQLGG